MTRLLCVLAVLVIATSAQAQDPCGPYLRTTIAPDGVSLFCAPKPSRVMSGLRLAAIGAASGDIVTTSVVLHQGGRETNPILQPPGTIAKAIAIDAGTLAGIYVLESRHPRIAKVLYVAVIATRGWATLHNAKEMRR